MKQLIVILYTLLFLGHHSYSQQKLEIDYETDDKKTYKFYSTNTFFCNYIVEISFTNLNNLRPNFSTPFVREVRPGKTFLFELKPENPQASINFNYTYKSIKGCINPIINKNFTYLLPIKPGKETEAFELAYFKIKAQQPEPKDWYAIGLKMNDKDTVYAARRGIVSNLRDTAKLKFSGYAYTSEENYIEICHDDCSFGTYQVLSKIFLELGQKVEAGDPIGLAGGKDYISGSHVRFLVSYNYKEISSTNTEAEKGNVLYYAYVPLYFHTQESEKIKLEPGKKYTSVHPDSLIIQEMNKRELKKWNKSKNNNL